MKEKTTFLQDLSQQMKRQNISVYAASTAFFLFLSMVPMLIMICTIIPFTPLTEENLVTAVLELTPDIMDPVAENLISEVYDKSAGVLSLAVIATIWSAGKGVLALMRGLNAINGVEEDRNYLYVRVMASFYTLVMLLVLILSLFIMVFGNKLMRGLNAINGVEEDRNYLYVRVMASFYTLVMLLVLILSLFIMVFGNKLVELALYRFPGLQDVVSFLMHFRFILVWVILTVIFCAIYAFVPNEKKRLGDQVPGAAFSAVVWSVFSWGFSIYVERTESYSIYGSLALIVIVMVWLYFCMYIIMVGAWLNRYFQVKEEEEA